MCKEEIEQGRRNKTHKIRFFSPFMAKEHPLALTCHATTWEVTSASVDLWN